MRKLASTINWEDRELVAQIYGLFLGTVTPKDRPAPKPELRVAPANTRLRLKLMPYLLKSREAANVFPACIQVIFDVLFGTGGNSNPKVSCK
jgi:proteasome component ECM29